MTDHQQLIQDEVMSTVERIENMDDPHEELDPLEIKVEASLDGSLTEVIAVLSTGGPHIEVSLYGGSVTGWWGTGKHSSTILDDDADELLTAFAEHYARHWEDNVIA